MPRTSTLLRITILGLPLSLVNTRPALPHVVVCQPDARVEEGDDGSGGDYLSFSIGETSSKAFEL